MSQFGNESLDEFAISKFKNDKWEFVEEVESDYETALLRAGRLQQADASGAQYRVWDCR